jgi:hypothetical protein
LPLHGGAPDYQDPSPNDDFPGAVTLFELRLRFQSEPAANHIELDYPAGLVGVLALVSRIKVNA